MVSASRADAPPCPSRSSRASRAPACRRGGIQLSDDDEPAAEAVAEPEYEPEPAKPAAAKVDDAWADMLKGDSSAPAKPVDKRPVVDDLWASMNAPVAKRPAGGQASAGGNAEAGGSAPTQPAAVPSAAVRYGVRGVSSGKSAGYVTVTQVKDFVGEKHVVSREVKVGSKEELALRAVGVAGFALNTPLPSNDDPPAPTAAAAAAGGPTTAKGPSSLGSGLRAAQALAAVRALTGGGGAGAAGKAPALGPPTSGAARASGAAVGGMAALLAQIDKPKKMSTMEKSALDWGKFKSAQAREEVEAMEKFSKDGYLEKQAFMARMDERQDAAARVVRRKRMGVKD